jgi:N-methylhydantoinase B
VDFGPLTGELAVGYVSDGSVNPPLGVRGGLAGGHADQWRVAVDGVRERLPSCAQVMLKPGERLISVSTGGGGYGPPIDRDPLHVARDVAERWIGRKRAVTVYGVALTEDGALDAPETERLRASMRRNQ